MSKYIKNMDAKNRVSIPSSYRSVLRDESFQGVIVYPSFKHDCIEACSISHLENQAKLINNLDPYSDERDAFETILFGSSVQLKFDNEGRVILPDYLIEKANIKDDVCFVGKGLVFELWQPELFNDYLEIVRKIAQNNRNLLKNVS